MHRVKERLSIVIFCDMHGIVPGRPQFRGILAQRMGSPCALLQKRWETKMATERFWQVLWSLDWPARHSRALQGAKKSLAASPCNQRTVACYVSTP